MIRFEKSDSLDRNLARDAKDYKKSFLYAISERKSGENVSPHWKDPTELEYREG